MRHSGRTLLVWLAATAVAALIGLALLPAARPTGAGFTDWLVAGSAVTGTAATGWLWVLVTLVVTDALRGRPVRPTVPAVVRRVVLGACGLTLAGGLTALAVPAHADRPAPPASGSGHGTSALLVGLPLPDRTTGSTQWIATVATAEGAERPARRRAQRPAQRPAPGGVTVAPGDTLWSLAEESLPVDATVEDVERRWRQIYAANRGAVGADPDLIRPGQRLLLPRRAEDRSADRPR